MALAFLNGANQQVPPVAFTAHSSATNPVLFVTAAATGSSTTTAVTYNGVAMTKIATIVSTTVDPNTEITLWVLVNPATGSNTVATTITGAGASRVSPFSFSGADQTTGYNSGAVATSEFTTAAAQSLSVTTQYTNSFLVGSLLVGTVPTLDSNTSNIAAWNNYAGIYTATQQNPAGAHAMGYTNSEAGVFIVAELKEFGAVLGGSSPTPTLLTLKAG